MNKAPQVNILLSTYNGERFLQQQLDSLTKQIDVKTHITIRDDGSSDKTQDIIKKFKENHTNCTLILGDNIGLPWAFFELMNQAETSCDYYAFCDQDDIWLPHKLKRAIGHLEQSEKPALYCSRQKYINEKSQVIGESFIPQKPISPENAWFENLAVGCTIVINRDLLDLSKIDKFEDIFMHDWWIYQVAHCCGDVFFDKEPTIQYRQHQNNQVGGNLNLLQKTRQRTTKLIEIRGGHQVAPKIQLLSLETHLRINNLSTPKTLARINSCKSFKDRVKAVFNGSIFYRQKPCEDFVWKALFLLNLL